MAGPRRRDGEMPEAFRLDAGRRLEIQLGRDFDGWWEAYFSDFERGGRPDALLRTEVRWFQELVRHRAVNRLGDARRADQAAILITAAGMLARDLAELDQTVDDVGAWLEVHAPRAVRLGIARSLVDASVASAPRTPWARATAWLRRRLRPVRPHDGPGARTLTLGRTTAVLRIGIEADMQFGVRIGRRLCVIAWIGDDGGRGSAPVPDPEPELAA